MRIAMIGGGYVGLVSGACFAEFGTDVTVVEVDAEKLAALNEGRMPIYEPGLDRLVRRTSRLGGSPSRPTSPRRYVMPRRYSLPLAHPRAAVTAMPTSPMCMRRLNRWRAP